MNLEFGLFLTVAWHTSYDARLVEMTNHEERYCPDLMEVDSERLGRSELETVRILNAFLVPVLIVAEIKQVSLYYNLGKTFASPSSPVLRFIRASIINPSTSVSLTSASKPITFTDVSFNVFAAMNSP